MSTVTFIIYFSSADFCTAFPKDFPVSQDNWSDCSKLRDFAEPEEWVWADSAVRVKVGSSHEMALLASSSGGFCPWRCSDIWLSPPVRAHTPLNLSRGMKKEEPLSPSLPFCFPSLWASMPPVCSPLSVSDHGDRQVMAEPAWGSFTLPARKSQHTDDNSCSFSVSEVVREGHGQTILTSVTHFPWKGHLWTWNPFPRQQAPAVLLLQTVSIFANQAGFLLFSHVQMRATGQRPHRDFWG